MEYVTLGRSGIQVSRLCLGMMSYGLSSWQKWVLPPDAGRHFVRKAIDSGINFFDTADFYSYGASEEILGQAIGSLTRRENVVISTKVGLPMQPGPNGGGLSRKHINECIEQSLRRLGTDYVDLYLLHKPDPVTPLEETLDAMHDLVRAGKVLYVGASNYPAWLLAKAVYTSRFRNNLPMTVNQLQYNLCYREDERDVMPLCDEEGLGIMVYSPLARGWLARNRSGSEQKLTQNEVVRATTDAKAHSLYGTEADQSVLDQLLTIAQARGVPPGRVAMSWVLSHRQVSSMLCGVLEDPHLDEALLALELKLSADEMAALEAPYQAQAVKDTGLKVVLSGSK